jgi:hypothetical protein
MKDIRDQTFYELLEIEPSASQEEILKAYNRARATYGHNSPALYSLFNKEEAQDLLKLIDEAYNVLSNQFKRKQYDSKSSGTGVLASPPPANHVQSEVAYVMPGINSPINPKKSSQFNRGISTRPSTQPLSRSHKVHSAPQVAPKKLPNLTPFGEYVTDINFEEEIKNTNEFSGPYLQKVRLYKNISLDQISEAIKVSRSYLMAIEGNNFLSLPAPVFVRGFVVQIAKILGLDQEKVANSYMKILKETQKK